MTLNSATRAKDALYKVRSRFKKHRWEFVETDNEISTFHPHSNSKKCVEVIVTLENELDEFFGSALGPLTVEEVLGITARERLKWLKDGRLATVGTESFKKNGITITYHVHALETIKAITPKMIIKWREDDKSSTTIARQKGAQKAVQTRSKNSDIRKSVRGSIEKTARDAALEVRNPTAVPIVKLAILTTICSRWARRKRDQNDSRAEKDFYELKGQALRVLSDQPWSEIRYVPSGQPRLNVTLCEKHREQFRDDRYSLGYDFWGWLDDNVGTVRKCKHCSYSEDQDYYALYEIRLKVGKADFCWHVPYSLGRSWLPRKSDITHTLPRSNDEEMIIFGRAVDEKEMIVWKPKKLREEIENLLRLFQKPAGNALPASRLP